MNEKIAGQVSLEDLSRICPTISRRSALWYRYPRRDRRTVRR
jgi:hypothetical protein